MANVQITGTQFQGNTITVTGTANLRVTCKLKFNGTLVDTQEDDPEPAPSEAWSVAFSNCTEDSYSVEASTTAKNPIAVAVTRPLC